MYSIYYPIILVIGSINFYLFAGKNQPHVKQTKKAEPKLGSAILAHSSAFRYTVFIKFNGKVSKSYEDDDICKIGYLIYTELYKLGYTHEIYIRNNHTNELMRIDKDYDSECMIGVDHPEQGHIGYLPFTNVTSL